MARPESAFKTMCTVGPYADGISLGFADGRRIFPIMSKPAMSKPAEPKARPHVPSPPESPSPDSAGTAPAMPKEVGGPQGPEPTRHGDWHYKGRCTDF